MPQTRLLPRRSTISDYDDYTPIVKGFRRDVVIFVFTVQSPEGLAKPTCTVLQRTV